MVMRGGTRRWLARSCASTSLPGMPATQSVAAVIMPLVGGIIWATYNYRWTFLVGAAVAVLSIVVSLRVPRHTMPAAVA